MLTHENHTVFTVYTVYTVDVFVGPALGTDTTHRTNGETYSLPLCLPTTMNRLISFKFTNASHFKDKFSQLKYNLLQSEDFVYQDQIVKSTDILKRIFSN